MRISGTGFFGLAAVLLVLPLMGVLHRFISGSPGVDFDWRSYIGLTFLVLSIYAVALVVYGILIRREGRGTKSSKSEET